MSTFMTVQEAADELKVSRWMIYQLIWANEVRSVTVGRCRRIVRKSFEDYVSDLIEVA
ncbi:excisionase family DNA-binding protein [Nocardia sp. NPDC050406]|uniref:excisionase family DNA-binding protein n=1 Tax=Nocardia sp. NPDC050406 TaxID=3364318 RepID=UPI0037B9D7F8